MAFTLTGNRYAATLFDSTQTTDGFLFIDSSGVLHVPDAFAYRVVRLTYNTYVPDPVPQYGLVKGLTRPSFIESSFENYWIMKEQYDRLTLFYLPLEPIVCSDFNSMKIRSNAYVRTASAGNWQSEPTIPTFFNQTCYLNGLHICYFHSYNLFLYGYINTIKLHTDLSDLLFYGQAYSITNNVYKGDKYKILPLYTYCIHTWKFLDTNTDEVFTNHIFVKNTSSETKYVQSSITKQTYTIPPNLIVKIDTLENLTLSQSSVSDTLNITYNSIVINGVTCLFDLNTNVNNLFYTEDMHIGAFVNDSYTYTNNLLKEIKSEKLILFNSWDTTKGPFHQGLPYLYAKIKQNLDWNYLKETLHYHQPYTKSDDDWYVDNKVVILPLFTVAQVDKDNVVYAVNGYSVTKNLYYKGYGWNRGQKTALGYNNFICPCAKLENITPVQLLVTVSLIDVTITLNKGLFVYIPIGVPYSIKVKASKYGVVVKALGTSYDCFLDQLITIADLYCSNLNSGKVSAVYIILSALLKLAYDVVALNHLSNIKLDDFLDNSTAKFLKGEAEITYYGNWGLLHNYDWKLWGSSSDRNYDVPTKLTAKPLSNIRETLFNNEKVCAMYRDKKSLDTQTDVLTFNLAPRDTGLTLRTRDAHGYWNKGVAFMKIFDNCNPKYSYNATLFSIDRYGYTISPYITGSFNVYGICCNDTEEVGSLYGLYNGELIGIPDFLHALSGLKYKQKITLLPSASQTVNVRLDNKVIFNGPVEANVPIAVGTILPLGDQERLGLIVETTPTYDGYLSMMDDSSIDCSVTIPTPTNCYINAAGNVYGYRFDPVTNKLVIKLPDTLTPTSYWRDFYYTLAQSQRQNMINKGVALLYRDTNTFLTLALTQKFRSRVYFQITADPLTSTPRMDVPIYSKTIKHPLPGYVSSLVFVDLYSHMIKHTGTTQVRATVVKKDTLTVCNTAFTLTQNLSYPIGDGRYALDGLKDVLILVYNDSTVPVKTHSTYSDKSFVVLPGQWGKALIIAAKYDLSTVLFAITYEPLQMVLQVDPTLTTHKANELIVDNSNDIWFVDSLGNWWCNRSTNKYFDSDGKFRMEYIHKKEDAVTKNFCFWTKLQNLDYWRLIAALGVHENVTNADDWIQTSNNVVIQGAQKGISSTGDTLIDLLSLDVNPESNLCHAIDRHDENNNYCIRPCGKISCDGSKNLKVHFGKYEYYIGYDTTWKWSWMTANYDMPIWFDTNSCTLNITVTYTVRGESKSITIEPGNIVLDTINIARNLNVTFSVSSSTSHIYVDGQWKLAKSYVKIGGEWRECVPYIRVNGEWKKCK